MRTHDLPHFRVVNRHLISSGIAPGAPGRDGAIKKGWAVSESIEQCMQAMPAFRESSAEKVRRHPQAASGIQTTDDSQDKYFFSRFITLSRERSDRMSKLLAWSRPNGQCQVGRR